MTPAREQNVQVLILSSSIQSSCKATLLQLQAQIRLPVIMALIAIGYIELKFGHYPFLCCFLDSRGAESSRSVRGHGGECHQAQGLVWFIFLLF